MTEKLARSGVAVPRGYEPDVLRHTRVGDAMTTPVDTLRSDASVAEARRRIAAGTHHAYPLVDADGRCEGIITRGDLLAESLPDSEPISRIASRDVVTVTAHDSMLDALERLVDEAVDQLPVVDNGMVVGICTTTDVLRARSRHLAQDRHQAPRSLAGAAPVASGGDPLPVAELAPVVGMITPRTGASSWWALSEPGRWWRNHPGSTRALTTRGTVHRPSWPRTRGGHPVSIAPDDFRRRAAEIRWFHSMDLAHGVRVHGATDPAEMVPKLRLPDLCGKEVLDVGAWDGFMSFEAERRGAARVLATDSYSWSGKGWGTKAGFELAREALGSKVEDYDIDVMDLSPEKVGTFDVVLCLGVLYHMRDPIGALERVASVTRDLLVLETDVGMLLQRRPAAAFYPDNELLDDPTNWWSPNPPAVLGMLRSVGFHKADVVWERGLVQRLAGWAKAKLRGETDLPLLEIAQRFRAVFHAWK
jgi:tRNA (mo5U34)-methyltransferase